MKPEGPIPKRSSHAHSGGGGGGGGGPHRAPSSPQPRAPSFGSGRGQRCSRRICTGLCSEPHPPQRPLQHVDDVGQDHQADDGEEHQDENIQHGEERAAAGAQPRPQSRPRRPLRASRSPAALQSRNPTAPQLGEAMPTPAARRGDADPRSRLGDKRVGARVQPGCGPARRSRRLRLRSIGPRCPRGSGDPTSAWKGVHPTGGAAPSKAMPPPGAPQSTAPKRDPLQRPLPSGSHPISVRPEAVGERQQRPRSRVYFFSRSVAVDDIQHSSARGAERGSKPQKAAGATPGAAQNRRKGFPKEDFPRNKDYFFRVFNCEPSGLHHQRERRWNGNSKRSWERQWGEQSHPPPSPHPLLRAGCRC